MDKKVYMLDGANFVNLQEFYDEVSSVLIPGAKWGKNLDAFNDILRGGFGTPEEGFILVWKNSNRSREAFGYDLTIDFLEAIWQGITDAGRLSYEGLAQRDYENLRQAHTKRDEKTIRWQVEQRQGGYREWQQRLVLVKEHKGDTIFDWLISIIRDHSDIELRLE